VRCAKLSRNNRENAQAHLGVSALRALLSNVVDYAGLYPPAALDMTTAALNYATYAESDDSWMLGRFIVPAARLAELDEEFARVDTVMPLPMRLSVVLGADVAADIDAVRAFGYEHGQTFSIDALEARLATPAAIDRASALTEGEFELFAEMPVDTDPEPLVAAAARAGASAKIRTGGVTPDAFPNAANVIRFMRRCVEAGVRFKATAGLHHPLRAEYALTYEPSPPRGVMYGYLNVFLSAAGIALGFSDDDARELLEERDPSAIVVNGDGVLWRGHAISAEQLVRMRVRVAVSFGSCSFREPVDELRLLSLNV
jgi:hypothetical protein